MILFSMIGQFGSLGMLYTIHFTQTMLQLIFFFSCSNDSINTGYADVSSSEHSVVTSVTRFNIAIHSVSQ